MCFYPHVFVCVCVCVVLGCVYVEVNLCVCVVIAFMNVSILNECVFPASCLLVTELNKDYIHTHNNLGAQTKHSPTLNENALGLPLPNVFYSLIYLA